MTLKAQMKRNDSTGFGDVSVALPVGTDLWLGDFDGQDIAIEPNLLSTAAQPRKEPGASGRVPAINSDRAYRRRFKAAFGIALDASDDILGTLKGSPPRRWPNKQAAPSRSIGPARCLARANQLTILMRHTSIGPFCNRRRSSDSRDAMSNDRRFRTRVLFATALHLQTRIRWTARC
jgi:hypothetical protein